MRSLFSGIFKDILTQAHQQLRARKVAKVIKTATENLTVKSSNHEQEEEEVVEIKIDQKEFLLKKEKEQEQLKQQYEQQFKKVEAAIKREQDQPSQKETIKEQKEKFRNPERQKKYKDKFSQNEQMSNVKYYSESELTKMIKRQTNPEMLFRLYNAHKFTYTTKNLVHTLTHYANLVKKEKRDKISSVDRRVQTLIFTLNSHSNMLSNKEKTLILWSLCKLNIQEDITEKLIQELVQAKQQLEFKDISIILWVMGKFSIKKVEYINDLTLEISLRLDDPSVQIHSIERKTDSSKAKTEEELEFEEMEDLLELPDTKENIIEPQSLSMTLWSLGKLGIYDEDLFSSALSVINANVIQFTPLMLTNILYAFSNIKFKNKEVYQGFCDQLKLDMKLLAEEPILTLKTLLIAICKQKIKDQEFIKEVVNIILDKSNLKKNPLSPRFMSEIIYYISKSDVYDEKIYNKIAKNVVLIANKMNVQDCCEVLYAFTKYQSQNKGLQTPINLICLRLIELEGKLDKTSKNMIQWSLKIGNVNNKSLLSITQK